MKNTKAHKHNELSDKLFIISQGFSYNCVSNMQLTQLAQQTNIEIEPLQQFRYQQDQNIVTIDIDIYDETPITELIKKVPQDCQFAFLNRLRISRALKNTQQRLKMVEFQFYALSIFVQQQAEIMYLNKFARSLPKDLLLPEIIKILQIDTIPQLHLQALNCLSAFLVMSEGQAQTVHEQRLLQNSTIAALDCQLQHGLIQTILRDATKLNQPPCLLPISTINHDSFLSSLLHLTSIVIDYQYRQATGHVSGMTASLLNLIQVPDRPYMFALNISQLSLKLLQNLIQHNIEVFKELDGMNKLLIILIKEIQIACGQLQCPGQVDGQPVKHKERLNLIRSLLRTLKTAITRWNGQVGHHVMSTGAIRKLIEYQLPQSFSFIFLNKIEDLYEVIFQFFVQIINDQHNLIPEFIQNGLIINALKVYDKENLPTNIKIIQCIPRFLSTLQLHNDGLPLIEQNFDLIKRILWILIDEKYTIQQDIACEIGELINNVVSRIPSLMEPILSLIHDIVCSFYEQGKQTYKQILDLDQKIDEKNEKMKTQRKQK